MLIALNYSYIQKIFGFCFHRDSIFVMATSVLVSLLCVPWMGLLNVYIYVSVSVSKCVILWVMLNRGNRNQKTVEE